jgi:hypothetical protein
LAVEQQNDVLASALSDRKRKTAPPLIISGAVQATVSIIRKMRFDERRRRKESRAKRATPNWRATVVDSTHLSETYTHLPHDGRYSRSSQTV